MSRTRRAEADSTTGSSLTWLVGGDGRNDGVDENVPLRDLEPTSEGVSEIRRFFEGDGASERRKYCTGGDADGVMSGTRGGGIIEDERDDVPKLFAFIL